MTKDELKKYIYSVKMHAQWSCFLLFFNFSIRGWEGWGLL